MKKITYWLIQISLVLLAVFGGKEIATATRTSRELIELKDQKIELLESKSWDEEKMNQVDYFIERLETNDLHQSSVYMGLALVVASFMMSFLHLKSTKHKNHKSGSRRL